MNAIRSTARRDGGDWVLNGEKCYVTNGGIAERDGRLRPHRRRDRRLPRRGRTIPAWPPGARSGSSACGPRTPARWSWRARGFPPTGCSARRAKGSRVALDFFEHSRPQVAAAAVGVARAAFEYATGYAREREAFGKPVIAKQGVSFKLAEMAMEIEAARLLVWRACAACDAGDDAGLFGSYAKAFAADAAMRATTEAVQVLGGAGIMRDHPVEKWLRDAKVFQIVEGTSEIQRHVITTLPQAWRC